MSELKTIEVAIQGMDCAECTRHVQHAIAGLPGVQAVDVYLTSERAVVVLDPQQANLPAIQRAVEGAGYQAVQATENEDIGGASSSRPLLVLLAVLFVIILTAVIAGEWFGLFETLNTLLPWWLGLALVVALGFPVFRNVVRAALKGQVIAHTLMTVGVIAALVVQEWMTALMVVFFMRVGDYVEHFTAERARQAVRDLAALAPQTARVEGQDGLETEIPAAQVRVGQVVVVRPGEKIPVDGEVVSGHATLDQSAITGESMPIEAGPGTQVFAATLVQLGSLRVRATQTGSDTTFSQIVRMVEDAERFKAPVERIADKFSAYYLPVVGGVAVLTYLISRDPLSTAAVLVVACSCAFALATPIAMLASIGAAARHGLMIKGGKYLEVLARADVVLIDKTGTLTLGKPEIVDCRLLNDDLNGDPSQTCEESILQLAASAERYSEHPLAEAVRSAARLRGLALLEVQDFEAEPGFGVRAWVDGHVVEVGNGRGESTLAMSSSHDGRGEMLVKLDGKPVAALAAVDTLRPETPEAIAELRALGIRQIELLTGDNESTAAELAGKLGIPYQARLLPQDKIEIVKTYQAEGHVVVMVGDGVNDAPALAQADVGIAMGAAGSDVAIEAAHIALMREDWRLVPEAFQIARRTMGVVKGNIAFTAVYNIVGLTLAAFGFLPPVLAAAAQSLPDLLILGNSSRLLRQK